MKKTLRLFFIFVFLVGLLAIQPTWPAYAAGIIVNTDADNTTAGDTFCTLREAITNADADSDTTSGDCTTGTGNDTITFAGNDTITLSSSLPDITDTDGVTITGNGTANTIVQSAASAGTATYRVIRVNGSGVSATFEHMTIRYGVSTGGAGISNSSGTLTLNYVTVSDNQTMDVGTEGLNGGGISTSGGTLTINNSTISNNSVTTSDTFTSRGNGGGIHLGSSGTLTLNNSTVSGNSSKRSGGGLYTNGGTINVNYSTITDNTAKSVGTSGTGGGLNGSSGAINLESSIVAGNKTGTSTTSGSADCAGTITSLGYNLTGDSTGCSLSGTGDATVSPSSVFTTVLDSSLASNGGSTYTHALVASGSNPAINIIASGTNSCGTSPFDLDQRDMTRPAITACDIGAYEYQDTGAPTVSAFSATSPSASLDIPITAFTASDDLAVTGYQITETSSAPSAGGGGWSGSAPGAYTVGGDGAYTLYPWAKDAAGNVSAVYGSPASVTVDTTAPTLTSITRDSLYANPTNASSVDFLIAFSESGLTGIDTSDFTLTTTGSISGASVTSVSSLTVTVNTGSGDGDIRLDLNDDDTIADAAGNKLGGTGTGNGNFTSGQTFTIDKTSPTVNSFSATSPSSSLNIPITAFTATDSVGVTGYQITETSTAPAANDSGWTGSTPTTYTVGSTGSYTLYPWAKDAAGNVSSVFGSPVAVTVCYPSVTVTSDADSGVGTLRQALADACAGATIDFNAGLSGDTIQLASTLELLQAVTIDGSSLASQITISGDSDNNGMGNVRVFYIASSVTATLDSLIVAKGRDINAAGIWNQGALTVTNSTISDNATQSGSGGGIYSTAGSTLTVTNSTFSGNFANDGSGGGIRSAGVLTVTNSSFSGNQADSSGGGIYSTGSSTLTVTNSTFSGNFANDGSGGGIYSTGSSTLTVTNSTFSANMAAFQGGGIYYNGGTFKYANTIIANSASGGDCAGSGTLGTNTNNLVEDGSCSASLSGDPSLDSLADNGGPTQTFALLLGSAAINAGDDTTCTASPVSNLDQRGIARPNSAHCDIGAYEYVDAVAPTVNSFSATSPTTSLSIPITAFTASDGIGVTGYLITETSSQPSSGASGWTGSAPATYTASGYGSYNLYPWAKDAAGNVSSVYGSPASVLVCTPNPITVTSEADSGAGTLRQAISDSCAGNTIGFDSSLSGETIYLASTLTLSRSVTIDGSSLASQITLSGDSDNDGDGDVRVFSVGSGVTAALDSLMITKGSATGSGGGGIYNDGTLTITNSTISGNLTTTSSAGGGIRNDSDLTITDSTFSGNSATTSSGGAIYNSDGSTLTISGSTFSGNSAAHVISGGGAIFNSGTLTVTNSTFSGNTSIAKGGGIFNDINTLTITNSTFSGNSAASGGGLYNFGGTLNYANTIIANSTSGGDCVNNSTLGINTNNLVENGSCSASLSGDPSLDSLADNGPLTGSGQAPMTFALIAGSSAIDAGDDTTCAASPVSNLDQRGVARPDGAHCDIGAYEADFSAPEITINEPDTSPTTSKTLTASASDGTLTMSNTTGSVCDGGLTFVAYSSQTFTSESDNGKRVCYKAVDTTSNTAYSLSNAIAGIDSTAPTVLSITRIHTSPTAKASVQFTVTFSESVTGITTADFSLTATVTGASVTGVSGSGATRTVTINTGSGNGTIRLDVPVSATIIDLAGNALTSLPYTSGQTYTVNKTLTYTSNAAQDGWLLETSELSGIGGTLNSTATTFNLGDDATRKQYRAVLSFTTSGIPDTAVITNVTLKVRKNTVVGGGDPVSIFQGFFADITTGIFGASALQTADFETAGSKTIGPTSPLLQSNWYSLNLTNAKTFINKLTTNAGLTQIRLRFKLDDNNNATANYLSLYSGNAGATNRPQLVITYYVP